MVMTKLSKYWLAIDKNKQTTIITLTILHFLLLPLCTSVVAASFQLCTMRDTYPSLLGLAGTSLESASFLLSAMRDTDSSLLCISGTPLVAASLHLSAMRDTDSSCIGSIGTPVEAASFPRCAMCDANSSFNNTIVTPLVAASLLYTVYLCAMRPAYSSLLCLIGTSLVAA